MDKDVWCRKNCISIKTFRHYEGIFQRQSARGYVYEPMDGTCSEIHGDEEKEKGEEKETECAGKCRESQGFQEEQETLKKKGGSQFVEVPIGDIFGLGDSGDAVLEIVHDEGRNTDTRIGSSGKLQIQEANVQRDPGGDLSDRQQEEGVSEKKFEKDDVRQDVSAEKKKVKKRKAEVTGTERTNTRNEQAANEKGKPELPEPSNEISIQVGNCRLTVDGGVQEETLRMIIKAVAANA